MNDVNRWAEREQAAVVRFVKAEYWRLAKLGDGRFAFTRAPITKGRFVSERQITAEPRPAA